MKVVCQGVNYFTQNIYEPAPVPSAAGGTYANVASATVSFAPVAGAESPNVAAFTLTYQNVSDSINFFPGKEYTLTLEEAVVQD